MILHVFRSIVHRFRFALPALRVAPVVGLLFRGILHDLRMTALLAGAHVRVLRVLRPAQSRRGTLPMH